MKIFSPEGFSILMLDYSGKEGYIHKIIKEIIYNFNIKGSPIVYNNEDAFMELLMNDPPINLIILNMDHLTMDAFEFVLMIRKSGEFMAFHDVPIFLVVEGNRAHDIFELQHIKINAFLQKPVSAQDIKQAMMALSSPAKKTSASKKTKKS